MENAGLASMRLAIQVCECIRRSALHVFVLGRKPTTPKEQPSPSTDQAAVAGTTPFFLAKPAQIKAQ